MRLRRAGLALLLLVSACTSPSPSLAPSNGPYTGPFAGPSAVDGLSGVRPYAGALGGGVVEPPPTGAWVGAWVRGPSLAQPARVAAVRDYEKALGRPLKVVNTYRRLEEPFDTASDRQLSRTGRVLMFSWATGDTRSITLGHSDRALRKRAAEIKHLGAPVLLRVRWEMDRPNLAATMWSAADYVASWHHIRKLFDAEGVRNVSWVWCPTAEGFAAGRAAAFYPGDAAVDWICVDAYAASKYASLRTLLTPFLTWASARPKPIVLGEFGIARPWGSVRRAQWLAEGIGFVRSWPQIKAVSYFESDPKSVETQHFRIANDAAVFAAYRTATASLGTTG